jgi:hypothetical protein
MTRHLGSNRHTTAASTLYKEPEVAAIGLLSISFDFRLQLAEHFRSRYFSNSSYFSLEISLEIVEIV